MMMDTITQLLDALGIYSKILLAVAVTVDSDVILIVVVAAAVVIVVVDCRDAI